VIFSYYLIYFRKRYKMNTVQAEKILDSMVAFIQQHGKEEVSRIQKSMGDEFTIQKNNYVEEEKKKITENYKNELANQEVRLKIEKSKQQNLERIQKMRKVNEFVEDLRKEMRAQIRVKMNDD
jgi:vacuolar-type H+-ATPase subunit E/Vma4